MALSSADAQPAINAPVTDPARAAHRRSLGMSMSVALIVLLGITVVALFQGPTRIAPDVIARVVLARTLHLEIGQWPDSAEQIIWQIRLPRVLLAGVVGGVLAMSGAAYQGVFRNPLSDPYLIGVAAGAGLGATLVFVSPYAGSWHGLSLVVPAAFAGALLAVALAYALASGGGVSPAASLILAGVAIAALCNAATSFLFIWHSQRLLTLFSWLMGGFNAAAWSRLWVVTLYAIPCAVVIALHARLLNVLLLDEEQARQLGVDVERVKLIIIIAASLAAAAAVSVSGLIGFVGLVVPHIVRLVVGPDHRRVLPLALVSGAALLIGADLVARTVLAPAELPVGIVTACTGAPFFLFLLRRGRRPAW